MKRNNAPENVISTLKKTGLTSCGKFRLLKKCIERFGKKVIFLTDETEYRSEERKICQWVCEQTDYILVTTTPYIKGFECEAIIDLTSMQEPDVLSRATIRVIKASGMMSEIIEIDNELFLTKIIGRYVGSGCTNY